MLTLWSKRWSVAEGSHWKRERECDETSAPTWLAVFSKDEPGVEFKLAARRPRVKA